MYSGKRFAVDVQKMRSTQAPDPQIFERILFTKYAHWRYEAEVRLIKPLEAQDTTTNLYFAEFSDDLRLRQVIVGERSVVSRTKLRDALGDLSSSVEAFKARLAFGAFRVVRQNDRSRWR